MRYSVCKERPPLSSPLPPEQAEAQKEAEEATPSSLSILSLLSRRNYSTDIIDSRQIKNLFCLEIVGAPERKIY